MRQVGSRLAATGAAVLAMGGVLAVGPAAIPSGAAGSGSVGSPSPVPLGARALGPLSPSRAVALTITLRPRNPGRLAVVARAVSTPGSPLYRHYLSPRAFALRFGAGRAAIARVTGVLRDLGLHPGPPAANGLSIPVRAAAAVVEAALRVSLLRLRTAGAGPGFLNLERPSLPGGVAAAIQGIVGLDSLDAARPVGLSAAVAARSRGAPGPVRPRAAGPVPCPAAAQTASDFSAYTPNQIAQAYGLAPLYAQGDLGNGQHVGLVEFAGYAPQDVQTYLSCFGIHTAVALVPVGGGARIGPGTSEATIDIEDLAGLVPDASLTVFEGANGANQVIYNAYSTAISEDQVRVLSTSWGSCEADAGGGTFLASENTLFEEAATQGQTIVAASGDDGSEDCYGTDKVKTLAVDDPASQPYVTGVGGTDLTAIGPPPTETAWNDNLGAGGGGISSRWPQPAWQVGPGVISAFSSGAPCHDPTGDCREVPDVAASAASSHPYVAFCHAGDCSSSAGWLAFFGTSLAAPVWAAVATLSNQVCAAVGDPPVGFLNPALYRLAASSDPPVNGVTVGNNDFTRTHGGDYPATPGYNLATGLGSPRAAVLAADLCPTLAATPAAVALTTTAAGPPATASIALTGAPTAGTWSASVTPAGTSWLSVRPPSGAFPATLTVTASATGLGPGSYTAAVLVRTSTGPTLTVPVTLAVTLPPSPPAAYTPEPAVPVLGPPSPGAPTGSGVSLGPRQGLTLRLAGQGGVPSSGATAVVLTLTASRASAPTFVSLYPAGGPRPTASELEVAPGPPAATLVAVQLGPTGAIRLYNAAGRVSLHADLDGWYGPAAPGPAGLFHPLASVRIADTRAGSGAADAGARPGRGGVLTVQVTGRGGVPATGVAAVALNVTVAGSTAPGALTAYPAGTPRPRSSSLSFPAGASSANRVIVPVGPSGRVSLADADGLGGLVVDVDGWFGSASASATGGTAFVAAAPQRVADTRPGSGQADQGRTIGPRGSLTVRVAGVGEIPGAPGAAAPAAVAAVVTATGGTTASSLTVYGPGARPRSAELDWSPGASRSGLVLVPLGPGGTLTLFNANGRVNAIVDVVGWFTPAG